MVCLVLKLFAEKASLATMSNDSAKIATLLNIPSRWLSLSTQDEVTPNGVVVLTATH